MRAKMKNKSEPPTATPPKASRTKSLALWLFNPRAWSDWDRSKSITLFFLNMIKSFFTLNPPKKKVEEFDTAVKKYDLDEEMLKAKSLGLKRLAYSVFAVAVFFVFYGMYQLAFGSIRSALIAFVEVGVALVLAFRYHFWHFQIEKRKLGCSVKEWFKDSFTGDNQ